MFAPLLFPVLRASAPHCYRCPLGLTRPDCAIACLGAVEQLLQEHQGAVAAVVIEPLVQGAAGMIVHPEGYLRGLSALCRQYNTLLIADEVAVGFGRTGSLFACTQENVTPDFLCLAKGLTGGYLPLAATLTTEGVAAAFHGTADDAKTFFHGHTYGGNPLGAAVALASLQVFDDEATLARVEPKVARLSERLREFTALGHVGDVRQRGLIAGVELVADTRAKTPFAPGLRVGARVCMRARQFGLLIRPLGDVLVIMPPLSIRLEELDEMLDVMLDCVRYVTEGRS
jgi:adenosylmethionine-8-amino-7-oxononanoate aminotransferase